MDYQIKPMLAEHYEEVYRLWNKIDGMDLNPLDDNPQAISKFLDFNPDLNYVAVAQDRIVGVIMCGFDGRRATIYHAAVAESHRGLGIGSRLLAQVERTLKAKNITKGRLLAFKTNETATEFWQKSGWTLQTRFNYFSKSLL
ncbi:GNAT family N-acetyltransferase [Caviibacterium pharyngocola]|uniref:GNAT family N-acetyltransferase n=1 Tax=Caviibacterium pharyngocola TaxID=28159 RepID=A0A2M8RU90_9PAST|nr:GNAT family N-acetyltransferase [Caviibacterium pharyngocola]PJG82449.1 GNAT family N-acetyltransferase [Caviibacterium pharyngocola]